MSTADPGRLRLLCKRSSKAEDRGINMIPKEWMTVIVRTISEAPGVVRIHPYTHNRPLFGRYLHGILKSTQKSR